MPSNLTRSTARIYGALTSLGDGSTDLLVRLLPFFEPILRPLQGHLFNLDEFAREVRDTYKWNFNTDVVEVFIPRLVEAGWLTAVMPTVEQTNYTITLPDQILDVEIEQSAERQLRAIAEKFQIFAQELDPFSAIPSAVEEFEEILIEWLLYVEAFSEKNLDFTTRTVKEPSGTLRRVVDVPRTTTLKDEENFLCARFVEHAITSDPEASETLARIASIGLLTEVIQDFVKPDTPVETSNLAVYLDAPVAMEVWARLRVCRGIRVSRKRVLRVMRENNLLSPHRCRRRGGNPHVGEIITHTPNLMWGTDGVRVFTVDDGWGWVFTAIEHWNAECVGWHVCKRGDRFAALQPISMGLARLYASTSAGAARGLALRMDHGSQYLSDHFTNQIKFWGIQPSYAFVEQPQTNGVAERFNRTLKEQIIHGRIYRNIAELRNAVRGFVEQYNAQWIVEKNGYLSPAQARQAWHTAMSLRPAA